MERIPQELTIYKNSSYTVPCHISGVTLQTSLFEVILIIKERDTYKESILVKSTETPAEGRVIDEENCEFFIESDDLAPYRAGEYVVGITIKSGTIVQPVAKASLLLIQPVEEA